MFYLATILPANGAVNGKAPSVTPEFSLKNKMIKRIEAETMPIKHSIVIHLHKVDMLGQTTNASGRDQGPAPSGSGRTTPAPMTLPAFPSCQSSATTIEPRLFLPCPPWSRCQPAAKTPGPVTNHHEDTNTAGQPSGCAEPCPLLPRPNPAVPRDETITRSPRDVQHPQSFEKLRLRLGGATPVRAAGARDTPAHPQAGRM